ncbi:MAG: hypothetical protein ACYCTE_16300 [Acidimicrobiales bacterium]
MLAGFGGNYGDCGDYHGWVLGVPESGAGPTLGSTAPVLLPGGKVLMIGKGAVAYLLRAGRLGGIGHEQAQLAACFATGGDAYLAPYAYLPCVRGTMTAIRVGGSSLAPAWRSTGVPGSSPTVASGVDWVLGDPGHLVGLDPRTGKVVLDVPSVASQGDAAPSVAEGLLLVGGSTQVEAFEGPEGYVPTR